MSSLVDSRISSQEFAGLRYGSFYGVGVARFFTPKGLKALTSTRRYCGVLICTCGVAAFFVAGLVAVSGNNVYSCIDILGAARLALSAQHALADGQFPLQFANDYAVALQPLFLYYTPVVFGLSAMIQMATGWDPYNSLLVVIGIIAAAATSGVYRIIRLLGGDKIAAGLASATLPFSPYFLTDVFARAALAELSAWALFPWVLFFFIKFCREPRALTGLSLILSSALFIMCHKIFLAWGAILLAVFGLSLFGWRRMFKLMPELCLCVLAALSLSAPYWLNAFIIAKSLNIGNTITAIVFPELTSNFRVFWPFSFTDPSIRELYRNFNLQLGPPTVAAMIVGLWYIREKRTVRAAWTATIVSTLFACSFFYASPIWSYFPTPLTAIQFPYRLLLFATTFGVILSGLVLSAFGRVYRPVAYAHSTLLTALLFGFWWVPSVSGRNVGNLANLTELNDGYFETGDPISTAQVTTIVDRDVVHSNGDKVTISTKFQHSGLGLLPVQYSRLLDATLNGQPAQIFNSRGLVAISVPAGPVEIKIHRVERIAFGASAIVGLGLIGILIVLLRLRPLNCDRSRKSQMRAGITAPNYISDAS
jgi:hypothetical protein